MSMRLENSMTAWMPSSGVGESEPASHVGQVGHPSPEPVTLTTPPPKTMRMLTTRDAVEAHLSERGESV